MGQARREAQVGRTTPLRRVLYFGFWLLANLFFRLWFRMSVTGRPRPFPSGPLVLAANHVSFLDPVVLALAVPRPVTYLVTSAVYYRPLYRPWMWIFGCIPVMDDTVNVTAMRRAIAKLRGGAVVGIFPEGGIATDGRLRDGAIGVASLLLKADAPVLTAALEGTFESLPRHGRFPWPKKLRVRFVERIVPGAVAADLPPRDARRLLRDRVMASIESALPPSMKPAPRGRP